MDFLTFFGMKIVKFYQQFNFQFRSFQVMHLLISKRKLAFKPYFYFSQGNERGSILLYVTTEITKNKRKRGFKSGRSDWIRTSGPKSPRLVL